MKDLNERFIMFTTEELQHALKVLKENDQEKNGRLLEYLGYDIAEELRLRETSKVTI